MYLRNILLAVGLAALLVGAALALLWAGHGASSASGARAEAKTGILVAAGEIRPGTLLRTEDMAWKDVPSSTVPPAAVVKAPGAERQFAGAVARRTFAAGEALVPGGLVRPGERGFLAAVLSPHMRAVSVSVDAATSTSGLIQPGDYVDAMLVQSLQGNGESHSAVSETVLQNVRVIAVDQRFTGEDGRPAGGTLPLTATESRVPKTVTLEVDENDAKSLLVAAQLGKVTLAMRALQGAYADPPRPRGDTEPVWAGDISEALRGGHTASRAPGTSQSSGRTQVQILRGSKTESK